MIVKTIVFISIAVILVWKDPAVATDPEKTELHETGNNFTLAHVKSLFGVADTHFGKIEVEFREKTIRITKLEEDISQLQTKIANYVTKAEVMKLLEGREKTNVVGNQEIQAPSNLNDKQVVCEKQNKLVNQLKETVSSYANKCNSYETQIEDLEVLLIDKEDKISQLETKIKDLTEKLNELKTTKVNSCTNKVTLSNGYTFEVLRNSDIAGPGWTVIQQRIRGGVDFNRNWTEYKDGFGSFWDGDFFLGLEKIHRLTREEPYELCIHMGSGDEHFLVRYNEFAISGEDDQYALSKLGAFSGNSTDELSSLKNMKFTTYDRKNDNNYFGNCAKDLRGAWWYNDCADCNLNGIYAQKKIYWGDETSLTQVRMLIRPKTFENNS